MHASINGKEILKGINLTVNPGEIHALMGQNGAGKSTLSNVLVGNPSYEVVELDSKLANRSVNEGFSGGEKKRNEIFQMAMLEPKLSILDETDSGLDVDALRIVAEGFNKLRTPETSALVITHYQRLLDYLKPDVVHVLLGGRIVKSGGPELAVEIENKGFDWIKAETSAV